MARLQSVEAKRQREKRMVQEMVALYCRKKHGGQVGPPGKLVEGRGRQNRQRQGEPHKQQIRENVVRAVKHGADQHPADRKPDRRSQACRQQCRR